MRVNNVKKRVIISILFNVFYCLLNLTYAEAINTSLSRDKVTLGETVTLSFQLNNLTRNTAPDLLPLEKDFRMISTNYGTSLSVVNGNTEAQTFWQVTLEPKTVGELLIPEISFGKLKSSSLKLLVKPSSVIQTDQRNTSFFVQADLSTTSPHIQSQVLYTFKLFYRTQLENPRIELPQMKNTTLIQVGDDKYYETTIKGQRFFVFEKNFAIFPQTVGKLVIPPLHFYALQIESNPPFMTNPFSITSNKLVTLATKPFNLNVQKIPDNYQGKTWLPAEQIFLTEEWTSDINKWEIGNPITRTIKIKAKGLRADQIPDLLINKNIPGVDIYVDPPHRSNHSQENSAFGSWEQKITYIPQSSQLFTIPSLQLHWWNTQTNTNAISQLKSITVQMRSGVNSIKSKSTDIIPVVRTESENSDTGRSGHLVNKVFYTSIWFWSSILLFALWMATLYWSRKKLVIKSTRSKSFLKEKKDDNIFDNMKFANKRLSQACKQGDAAFVQEFILMWARKQWENSPQNLRKIREIVGDEILKNELENLEKFLYAGKATQWDGNAFFAAFQQVQSKMILPNSFSNACEKKRLGRGQSKDPLPPLYP